MILKQKFGVYNFIVNLFRKFFRNLQPRYQLSLDDKNYDINSKIFKYRFKSYWDHNFIVLSFSEIKNNKQILYNINPHDLMTISVDEYINQQKFNMLRISEILRDNKYLISDGSSQQIFDGDEICENILLIDRMCNVDLYKIAYSTGFVRGRSISKLFGVYRKEKYEGNNNIVKLNI